MNTLSHSCVTDELFGSVSNLSESLINEGKSHDMINFFSSLKNLTS